MRRRLRSRSKFLECLGCDDRTFAQSSLVGSQWWRRRRCYSEGFELGICAKVEGFLGNIILKLGAEN